MATLITEEQMKEQKAYIMRLKEDNMRYAAEYGHTRRALTETYGCQQNENDTERIRGMLKEAGFEFTDDSKKADVVIYNTCAVRENAEQKVFGRLGLLKPIKERRRNMVIGVCGCMVQQEHITEKIKKSHEHVDLVFGTHALYKMPELLWKAINSKKTVIDIEDSKGAIAEDIPIMREDAKKAWVSVMYGCNNFCTYCIVPYVRGRERSRTPEAVIAEVKELVAAGCSEISLLGQNVNSYGKDLDIDIDFADLMRTVNDIEGVERIRFMTSHPKDLSDKLINTMAECDKVCKQLHLPFQAGSNKILKQMNRGYTKEEYLEKIAKVKKAIPNISLSTDVIVGFPTETNEDFEETLDVLRKVEYDNIFSFIYSRREGTPAAKLNFVLTDEEIHKNFDRLLEVQNAISLKKNKEYVGRIERILVDGASKTNPDVLAGRCDSSKIVNFKGDESLIGKYIDVRITEAHTWSLNGELVKE
ncbi:MAG: tRNA (N6-isopentenyl adenosine(37)-C2)-methylthiotransferase MiaB [Clostridia bacterium]|nr:tRNA (N6-isopentenyl adenosine(37)-C2)-methylthiotransferase MiaB [Clostridia bacterium]